MFYKKDLDNDGFGDKCDKCINEPVLVNPRGDYEILCDDLVDDDCDLFIDCEDDDCLCFNESGMNVE